MIFKTVKDIIRQLMVVPIGGKINEQACKYINNTTCEIHCWNGERYLLQLTKLEDGCHYDMATGKRLPKCDCSNFVDDCSVQCECICHE